MTLERSVQNKIIFIILILAAILSACGQQTPETPTAVPTNTLIPTATFTPAPSTPLAIIILPADLDPTASALYQSTVYALTQQAGFRFQVRNTLLPADLTDPTLKVVIVFPPDPGIAALAPTAPQTQFLAVNIPNVAPGGNISVLSPSAAVELPAFMAGFIAAMITDDYHIGMVYPRDNPDAQRAAQSFKNGMVYFCGACKPFNFPGFCIAENLLYCYPQNYPIPNDEDPARYSGYANYLINDRVVRTLYIYPDMASADLLTYIGTTGALQIGTKMPAPRPAGWVTTLQPDVVRAIQQAWPSLVAGQGGINVQSPLSMSDVDPALLTPGKQQQAQQILDALVAGLIAP